MDTITHQNDAPLVTEPALAAIVAELARPFSIAELQVRPGAVSADGTRAIALPYAAWRLYAERLDHLLGPTHWSIQLIPWGPTRVIARLTILGITKDASGEGDPTDANCGTIAEAQAKKRACAEFGLGRYFYTLPKVWGNGQGTKRDFRFAAGEPQRCIHEMYRQADLLSTLEARHHQPPAETTPADRPTPAPLPTRPPAPAQLAKTHAAEESKKQKAESRNDSNDPLPLSSFSSQLSPAPRSASARQRSYIVTLLHAARGHVQPGTLNALGQQIGGFPGLSGVLKPEGLPQRLSSTQASRLIDHLVQLTTSDVTA